MRMRQAGSSVSDVGGRRRGGVRSRVDVDAGWRSHTFADGVCSITLDGALDAVTVERLGDRLREMRERGCERLIVDVSAAVAPGSQAPGWLAAVFDAHESSCEIVVVTAPGSVLDGLLPARVAVAWSLSDARRLLAIDSEHGRARPSPAAAIGAADRHTLAVRQALRWAAQTAGTGDYENALRGLATIERVEGALPDDWNERRQTWLAASREQATRRPRWLLPGRRRAGTNA